MRDMDMTTIAPTAPRIIIYFLSILSTDYLENIVKNSISMRLNLTEFLSIFIINGKLA